MFFSFPEDARWNADLQAVEFGIRVGEYEGVVRVPRHVFRRFIDGTVAPPQGSPRPSDKTHVRVVQPANQIDLLTVLLGQPKTDLDRTTRVSPRSVPVRPHAAVV
jgi:hypothetical protein